MDRTGTFTAGARPWGVKKETYYGNGGKKGGPHWKKERDDCITSDSQNHLIFFPKACVIRDEHHN